MASDVRKLLQNSQGRTVRVRATPFIPRRAVACRRECDAQRIHLLSARTRVFDPQDWLPAGMKNSGSLAKAKCRSDQCTRTFQRSVEPSSTDCTAIQTRPSHSAFFGSLGGYRAVTAAAESSTNSGGMGIYDPLYELSQVCCRDVLPHLCIGMGLDRENWKDKRHWRRCRTSGAGSRSSCTRTRILFYRALTRHFLGTISPQHEPVSVFSLQLEKLAAMRTNRLPARTSNVRNSQWIPGRHRRRRFGFASADHLRSSHRRWTIGTPTQIFETVGTDVMLDSGIRHSLGITNTLTIGPAPWRDFGA